MAAFGLGDHHGDTSVNDLLTTQQAAAELGICEPTLPKLVYDLKLRPASGTNPRTWLFTHEAIEQRKRDVLASRERQRPSRRVGR